MGKKWDRAGSRGAGEGGLGGRWEDQGRGETERESEKQLGTKRKGGRGKGEKGNEGQKKERRTEDQDHQ